MLIGIVDPATTRELRRAVLRPNLAAGDPLPGDDVPTGVHLGVSADDGTVLSTCFVFPDRCEWLPEVADAWHLRQMATAPDRRGQGLGAAVLVAALDYVRGQRGSLVWCYAREQAAEFYARQQFRPYGEIFTDERHTIPHLRMWRELREPAAGPTSSER